MSAICGGGSRWGRGIFRCPICKARRRLIKRLVFGGYSSDAVCGGCGIWISDGVYRKPGKREAERNRDLVREERPRAASPQEYREIVYKELDDTPTLARSAAP